MVYPVSSPLIQQQIPGSNTFQPGGTEATKAPEENTTTDSTRPSGTDTARTERSTNRDTQKAAYQAAEDDRSRDNGAISASTSRGTQLDLTA